MPRSAPNLPKHADFAKDVISDADGNTLALHRPPSVKAENACGNPGGQILEPVCDAGLQETAPGSRLGSESLVTVFIRMVWQHVKLACWLTVGLGIVMLIFSANSKKSAQFQMHPIQWIFQLIVALVGLPLLLFCVFVEWLYDGHRVVFNLGLLVLYLVWLAINAALVITGEYWVKHGTRVRRQVEMEDVWGPEYEKNPRLQDAARPWLDSFGKGLTDFTRECGNTEYNFSKDGFYREMVAADYRGRDQVFKDQMADLPVKYTFEEQMRLVLPAMAPWLLAAALVLAAVPWHGAADAACYSGCSTEEVDAVVASTPVPRGSIGKHELSGKVTIVVGEYAGGGMLDCSMGYSTPEDGTYTVSRVNDNRLPDKDGDYLEFPPNSFLERGVEYKRIICRDSRKP